MHFDVNNPWAKGSAAHLLVVTNCEPSFRSILNPRKPGICCMKSSLLCHAASNSSSLSSGTMNLLTHCIAESGKSG